MNMDATPRDLETKRQAAHASSRRCKGRRSAATDWSPEKQSLEPRGGEEMEPRKLHMAIFIHSLA